jgi:hypothetical protein
MPGELAVERMSVEGLWKRLGVALADLDPDRISVTAGERARKREAWREARRIVADLKLRGFQLSLDV